MSFNQNQTLLDGQQDAQALLPMHHIPAVTPTQGPQQPPQPKPSQRQATDTTPFNWAVRKPGEFTMSKSKTPQNQITERSMPLDALLDEPDERPMDMELSLSESTLKLDTLLNRTLLTGQKRPRTNSSSDEGNQGQGVKRMEMEQEQVTNPTENANSLANDATMAAWVREQPGLAQEIDAHFEQADEREARTEELQRSYHQFVASIKQLYRGLREVKQEPIDEPSEFDQMIALQEQQSASTSASTKTLTAQLPDPVQQKPSSSKRVAK